MVKIYSSGNYFYVVKDDILYEGLTSEVLVKRLTPTSTEFNFEKLNNWTGDSVFLVDIQDEAGHQVRCHLQGLSSCGTTSMGLSTPP